MILLVMGPQGSGKSTQGKLLAKKYGLTFISTGEIFRSLYKSGDKIGIEAEKYWGNGELVPDEIVLKVLKEYFRLNPSNKGYVVDGFPRRKSQFHLMEEAFPEPVTVLVFLTLTGGIIKQRLKKRWHLEHRPDEQPKAIKKRLEIYAKETEPLIKEFKKHGVPVIEIDASPSIEEIFSNIEGALKERNLIDG